VATGRADWTGWFELRRQDVTWKATRNTARAIAQDAKPDVLVAVEVESRPTLDRFNEQVLRTHFNLRYPHVMAIDGNDERGIDLGILSRFPVESIRSHIDDLVPGTTNRVYSRDCPEYDVILSSGVRLIVLANHFKSKRGGDSRDSMRKRTAQADRTHQLVVTALARSPYVVIAGDLNDTPDSTPLASLFGAGFKDVQSHPSYPTDRPGTFKTGLAGNKIDYLIMSPELFSRLDTVGIERRGSYHPNSWEPFDTVTDSKSEASDHHLLWADVQL
jgi:endonuclease/exonuclease/phosphatase family metal-dependent hydrolase